MMPGQNPYDFITSPGAPRRGGLIGDSKQKRIIIAAAGGIFLIFAALIVFALLSSAGKGDSQAVLTAAKQQQELIRISENATKNARSNTTKNLAVTMQLSLTSDQADLQAIAKKQGVKIGPKDLVVGNAKTDLQLTEAVQANRFDEVFTGIAHEQLLVYQASLKKLHDGAPDKASKDTLAKLFENAGILLGPSPAQ